MRDCVDVAARRQRLLHGRSRLLASKLTAWSSIRAGLTFGLSAFSFFLVMALIAGEWDSVMLEIGVASGLATGFGFWLTFGLTERAKTPLTNEHPQTPAATFHRDLQLAVFYLLVAGLMFGLVVGLIFELVSDPTPAFMLSTVVLLTTVGIVFGLGQSSGKHLMTVAKLRTRRRVPLRLLAFLDDAHRLGILREVGPVYQFRHAKLQDRLAQTYTTRPQRTNTAHRRGHPKGEIRPTHLTT